jgi:hypothetical protein
MHHCLDQWGYDAAAVVAVVAAVEIAAAAAAEIAAAIEVQMLNY